MEERKLVGDQALFFGASDDAITRLLTRPVRVVEVGVYRGPHYYSHTPMIRIQLDLGRLEDWPSDRIDGFADRLLKRPWADPARVFAAGGSYGGFMVAWMNGHVPPGRYAAYVCHAGCFDWTAMFAGDAWGWHSKELGAWYWEDPQKADAQNPRASAQNLSTPTLVIHGAKDYRVPDAQGLAYYNTLKARGG